MNFKKTMMIGVFSIFLAMLCSTTGYGSAESIFLAAQPTDRSLQVSSSDAIAGAWRMSISSSTFPEPFRALLTFDGTGGVVGSAQGDILLDAPPGVPPLATTVHGAWSRTANRNYLFTLRQIFYYADGSFGGSSRIRNSATVSKSGNQMTGNLIVDIYDTDGNVVFTGTGTFTATRIVAEPLN